MSCGFRPIWLRMFNILSSKNWLFTFILIIIILHHILASWHWPVCLFRYSWFGNIQMRSRCWKWNARITRTIAASGCESSSSTGGFKVGDTRASWCPGSWTLCFWITTFTLCSRLMVSCSVSRPNCHFHSLPYCRTIEHVISFQSWCSVQTTVSCMLLKAWVRSFWFVFVLFLFCLCVFVVCFCSMRAALLSCLSELSVMQAKWTALLRDSRNPLPCLRSCNTIWDVRWHWKT